MVTRLNINELNPQQAEVVRCAEGPVLVLAGAGTGKTRTVTFRIAHLILNCGVKPESILAVTFTNKAAAEMRERTAQLVGRRLASQLTMSTFHSLCVRILRNHAEAAGLGKNFSIYDESDQVGLIRSAISDLKLSNLSLDARKMLYRISTAKNHLLTPADFRDAAADKYGENSALVYEAYQQRLEARNAVDFDDLIMKTIRLFRTHPEVLEHYQSRFKYISVDEFQDTNFAQFKLVEMLSQRHGNLCVVGDDDQSIYSWRGAQVSNILDFERSFKGVRAVKLEENYRSGKCILDVANALIANNSGRKPKQLWSSLKAEGAALHLLAKDEDDEAVFVTADIERLNKRFKVPFSHFAILYRSNVQSRPFEEQLRKKRIPYRLFGGQSFYDRKEVRDVVAYLRLIHNPWDEASLLRIINVPRRGVGETTVVKLLKMAQSRKQSLMNLLSSGEIREVVGDKSAIVLKDFARLIHTYSRRFENQPLGKTFERLLEEINFENDLKRACKTKDEYSRRWESVMDVLNSMASYCEKATHPTLGEYLEEVSLITREDRPKQEGHQDAVSVMTIHSAKGLEFPYVYVVGMEEKLLPHARSLDDGSEALLEERRLCYVALTRAEKYLMMTRADTRHQFGKVRDKSPSRFLHEMPKNLIRFGLTPAMKCRKGIEKEIAKWK